MHNKTAIPSKTNHKAIHSGIKINWQKNDVEINKSNQNGHYDLIRVLRMLNFYFGIVLYPLHALLNIEAINQH